MTISRTLTSLSVAAAVAASALIPLASSANAGSRHYRSHGPQHFYDGGHSYRHVAPRHYAYGDGYHYGYRKKRRNNVGKAIAIGAGLLMLGIIASESQRGRRYR